MKTGRVSDTAVLIGRSILLAEATPAWRELVAPERARLTRRFLADGAPSAWFEFCLKRPWARAALLAAERFFLPGIFLHYLTRKLRLAAWCAGEATPQQVVLGAGLDTLAWGKTGSKNNAPARFELDHPVTQAIKHRAARDEPNAPVLLAADLMNDSPAALLKADPRFDPRQPTTFVAEGLFMYFPEARVESSLRELAAVAAPGSRLALTFMEPRADGTLGFHNGRQLVNVWLKARQEPFRWGLPREEMNAFAARLGWRLTGLSSEDDMRTRYLAPLGLGNAMLARGETIAFFERVG